jgi:Tol biopolymer transport system component
MNIVKCSPGAFTAFALVLMIGLVSCSDDIPTEPTVTKPSYKIAFVSQRDASYGVFTMNNDGSDQKRLTVDDGIGLSLSWSPDGSKIAFTFLRYPHDDRYEIHVVRADGTFPTRLTTSAHLMGEIEARPVWSPDGSKLAFRSYRNGNSEIYVMNADGSNQTNVTHDPSNDYDPAWWPDGMGVAFLSAEDTTSPGVRKYWMWFVSTDGARRETIHGTWYDSLSTFYWFPIGATLGFVDFPDAGRECHCSV